LEEEREENSNKVEPEGETEVEKDTPLEEPPLICEVLSGKLGLIKRIEWPSEMGQEMLHGRKIIFEDSYGTDWAIVLRPGSLVEEEDDEESAESTTSGPQEIYTRGHPREPLSYDEEEEFPEEEQIDIALSKLEGRAVRYCDEEDEANIEHLAELEAEAMDICGDRIKAHGLPMKLLASDYRYDRSKVTFHFSAENRVDFRQLVRDLASIFKCRIELHQIGIRDEAKLYPGLGPCGETQCCQRHLTCFRSVSIRMARLQNLPLNPSKISGNCGRLMCCLNYEFDTYSELTDILPNIGDEREIDGRRCTVVFISPLTEMITVQANDETSKKSTITKEEYDEGRTKKPPYIKKQET
jgi:cell fate regulator YaaT (PSP1 superfamily)